MIALRSFLFLMFLALNAGIYYLTKPDQLSWVGDRFPFINYALVCVLSLFGILFGSLFRQIAAKSGTINIVSEFTDVLRSSSFWSAILITPFLFGSTFVYLKENPGDATAYMLAFQNGFFCESIVKQVLRK